MTIMLPNIELSVLSIPLLVAIGYMIGRLRQRSVARFELRRADRHVQEMAEQMVGCELDMQEAQRAVLAAKEQLLTADARDRLRTRQVNDLMDALAEHHMETGLWAEFEGGTQ